ncbi:uncharacterized protein LOC129369770 [Poeciliopsis prolifica]|uniref:uncharacterized protein LOC129369770 n=1 Tax=Poeciliopsis prolifica TaxID=188132 RepID=UPI0024134FC2|nr:uncharacterized protein LOC129369770 [Poeciliopsis prolifica]
MHTLHASKMACLISIVVFVSFYSFVSGGSDANEASQRYRSGRTSYVGAKSEDPGMRYCGGKPYSPETDTCCEDNGKKETDKMSERVSKCCGLKAYNPLNEMCCDFTLQAKPSPMAECCGKAAFNSKTQLCCGINRTILNRSSPDHECCHAGQYNTKTQCCCSGGRIQDKVSGCCGDNRPTVTGNTSPTNLVANRHGEHFCGLKAYDPKTERCCQRKHGDINALCSSGMKPTPTLYNPETRICCDGCLTKLKPWMDQCCGDTPYGLAQRGVLCCKNRLFHKREDGEECSESGEPYKPSAETVCAQKRHNSPGGHCCGEELYQPNKTVCCKGQRHNRGKHIRCCGIHAYNISNPLKKCCQGTLHNLTTGEENDLKCCGSELLNSTDVCCSSEEQSVLYPSKDGFKCCGHHYYNSALWWCCSGKLSPVHRDTTHKQPTPKGIVHHFAESKLQLVNNLNKTQLCNEVFIGVVESVSRSSTVFSNVLKIKGKVVTVESDVFILETPDQCKFFKLTAGKTYFFNHANVFADFNHESVLQSLHFILSKCSQ